MTNRAQRLSDLKKRIIGGYIRGLQCIDPQVATHILTAQREAFAAGKAFFEVEMNHADRAIDKIRRHAAAKTETPDAG